MKPAAVTLAMSFVIGALPVAARACDYKAVSRGQWQCASQGRTASETANLCDEAAHAVESCAGEHTGAAHFHFMRMDAQLYESAVPHLIHLHAKADARRFLAIAIDLNTLVASSSATTAGERSLARSAIAADRRLFLSL
ncbi:MAG TPA: hypothetical protein VFL13_01460 [Candidatus Baltobacteraceae bacterium]|nr:hypothetical protein [Candidatus Baltobacteraceae bacterium]